MSGEDKKRAILRTYLLGELPEPERSRLAELYFVDDELFDELLEVENELLDQYVHSLLSPEERKSFREYLGSLPDGPGKLATAYALMEAANAARETSPAPLAAGTGTPLTETTRGPFPEATPVSPSRREPLRAWLLGDGHFLRYAVAMILIALAAGLAYLIVTQRELRREAQLSAERTRVEQEKDNLVRQEQAAQRDRNRRPEQELGQARRQQEQQKQAQDATQQPESDGALIASLVLTPALRSGGTPELLTLSRTAKSVLLVVPLPKEEQIPSYRAVLQTTEGQLIFRQERLRPQSSHRGRTISLRLPAARLTSDSYKLTLQGKAADGSDIAQDYYFNISRK